jgi:ribosomal protein S18 acetylase RimI-like enzyme
MEEGRALGFLTLKLHFPWAAEIYVMGVRPETHRRGIGRALLARAEAYLREQGVEYLQVKTSVLLTPTRLLAFLPRRRFRRWKN